MKLLGVAIMVLVPIVALGHETRLHRGKPTEGEVASVQGDHLSLKTAAGSVPVTLTDGTKVERESQQATRADLAPGTHVAVFGTKLPTGELVAREIVIEGGAHHGSKATP